ncbi:MAG: hypothetical protein MJ198_05605 [Bacteroidales bacterium]|nr:hypothetical protein [Bacteroidales bacterium]
MKNFQVILFFLGVISLLGLVCFLFPKDGIEIRLNFPSIEEVFLAKQDTVDLDKNLQVIEKDFIASLDTMNEISQNVDSLVFIDSLKFYKNFDSTSVARIYFPKGNSNLINSVFEIIENHQKHGMLHILHYGDSQIELDRISGYFRQALQEHFGGNGVGLLPIIPLIQTTAVNQGFSDSLPRYVASGTMRQKLPHNRYGILAQMAQLNGSITLNYTSRDWKQVFEGTKQFSKVRLFVGNNKSGFKATLSAEGKDSTLTIAEENFGMSELSWSLKSFVSSCSLKLKGNAELYGISLESEKGVTVDNIPLRGSAGNFFTTISSSLMQETMTALNVPMVILEYGGNAVPSINSELAVENYKKDFARQIRYFQNVYPEAFILIIGPADMSIKVNGTLQTRPYVEDVVQAMKDVALENGAAFWNMFDVMGGKNSMIQWVSHKPAWAAPDYIHFTHLGAKRIAELFTESFFHYYEYYKFLQRNSHWIGEEEHELEDDYDVNQDIENEEF